MYRKSKTDNNNAMNLNDQAFGKDFRARDSATETKVWNRLEKIVS